MPLTGGAADKFGIRYETLWTVSCMLDVLDEHADSLRLEPPGKEGEGVEFWIRRGEVREYHQVKRQHGGEGRWTLKELGSRTVLSSFQEKLNDSAAMCVFVSSHAASQLGELAERSRGAESWQEFEQEFLSEKQSRDFATLRNLWGDCTRKEAFERLQRIEVRTLDERSLSEKVEVRLQALVEGDPSSASDVLFRMALDEVHEEVTAYDVWRRLEERGLRRRDWANDTHVLAKLEESNARYLSPLRNERVSGASIPREEARVALDLLTTAGDKRRGALLSGEAGVGKSGVVLQVLEELHSEEIPVLAFRVDRLSPTPLPNEIGRQLNLPGSPVAVLGGVAQGRECVLVIDQLDAVSLASGRHPQFFDGIDELIRQTEAYPRMRLLIACRSFDVENDHRLRRLAKERGVLDTVTIDRLPEETVREVVAAMGIEAGGLSPDQVRLMSIPLHLSLLAEISGTSAAQNLNFRTAKDLFDRFWERKRDILRERTGHSVQWTEVIDALCDHMSEKRTLSAPAEKVDKYEDDARAMASENVLVRDRDRYAFFHENFFDYAFARRFAGREQELLPFLREGEQHLFRRAQVRQILRHEREADRARYLEDLGELLHSSDVRFHIKQVVFALLATLEDPTREEWRIVAPLLEAEEEPYRREIFNLLRSASWFGLIDSLGLWERWLAEGDEERLNRVAHLLWMAQKHEPGRVAELLEPYVSVMEWRNRIAYIVSRAELHTNRRFFEMFLKAINEGVLDEADVGMELHYLPDKNPEWAGEALYYYLKRCQERDRLTGGELFDSPARSGWNNNYEKVFTKSAQHAPRTFVTELLPFMLKLTQDFAEDAGDPPYEDSIWRSRYPGKSHSIEGALLRAMETALRTLAENDPESFDTFARLLRDKSNFETAQYLLVRSYTANGERYADEAVEYLLESSTRLKSGYAGNLYWAARQLLEAATPHCSEENMAKLEDLILGHYSEWELEVTSVDRCGLAQLVTIS